MNIFSPPNDPFIMEPTVFLAGPIQGVYDWQSYACGYLINKRPDINIANPRRDNYVFDDETYAQQVDWEMDWLRRCGERGAIMFWLAAETDHICDRAYAQTSRYELAEWLYKKSGMDGGIMVALGIEEGFPGAKYIHHRWNRERSGGRPIRSTLEETCEDALAYIDLRYMMGKYQK